METIKGKVVKIIDAATVVINKGSDDGVKTNSRFLLYYLDEEIFDAETNKSLGILEIVCGIAKVKHIQKSITTIVSDEFDVSNYKTIRKDIPFSFRGEEVQTSEKEVKPFNGVSVGCLVKQIY